MASTFISVSIPIPQNCSREKLTTQLIIIVFECKVLERVGDCGERNKVYPESSEKCNDVRISQDVFKRVQSGPALQVGSDRLDKYKPNMTRP